MKRVADADDPGGERDLLSREPVRVAAPVPVLVARADERRDALEGERGQEDALADDGVLPDELPLALVERAGLVEDLVRHGELPEIVQLRRTVELVELGAMEAQPAPDVDREAGDVLDVRLEVGLSGVVRASRRTCIVRSVSSRRECFWA